MHQKKTGWYWDRVPRAARDFLRTAKRFENWDPGFWVASLGVFFGACPSDVISEVTSPGSRAVEICCEMVGSPSWNLSLFFPILSVPFVAIFHSIFKNIHKYHGEFWHVAHTNPTWKGRALWRNRNEKIWGCPSSAKIHGIHRVVNGRLPVLVISKHH